MRLASNAERRALTWLADRGGREEVTQELLTTYAREVSRFPASKAEREANERTAEKILRGLRGKRFVVDGRLTEAGRSAGERR